MRHFGSPLSLALCVYLNKSIRGIAVKLELANIRQLAEVLNLVNLAYRGEIGWTKETDIVQGNRATESEIERAILDPNSHFLVYVENNKLLACIRIEAKQEEAHIGLFAVDPQLQGKGIGKMVLAAAEKYAASNLYSKKFVMAVVSQRPELIAYYERRGYSRTGFIEEYPVHLNVGIPKTNELTVEYLAKYT